MKVKICIHNLMLNNSNIHTIKTINDEVSEIVDVDTFVKCDRIVEILCRGILVKRATKLNVLEYDDYNLIGSLQIKNIKTKSIINCKFSYNIKQGLLYK